MFSSPIFKVISNETAIELELDNKANSYFLVELSPVSTHHVTVGMRLHRNGEKTLKPDYLKTSVYRLLLFLSVFKETSTGKW